MTVPEAANHVDGDASKQGVAKPHADEDEPLASLAEATIAAAASDATTPVKKKAKAPPLLCGNASAPKKARKAK